MHYIVPVAISYLLGSVIFSVVIGRLWKGTDIRRYGSGNAGATNTLRVLGKGPALSVLMLDIGKGVLAVWIGKWFADGSGWIPVLCGLGVIIGHNWPIFFRFKGGKGIATTIGVVTTLCFLPALYAGIIGILAIALTRYVSLGSLLFTAFLTPFLLLMHRPQEITWAGLIIFLFAFLRHRKNIVKLFNGTENKIGKRA